MHVCCSEAGGCNKLSCNTRDIDSEHIWVITPLGSLTCKPVERRSGTPASARAGKTHRELFTPLGCLSCKSVKRCPETLHAFLKSYIICAGKTHRELFSEFYEDLLRAPLAPALAACPAPPLSAALFQRMMHDILSGGQTCDPVEQVCPDASLVACVYASGNLATELPTEQTRK